MQKEAAWSLWMIAIAGWAAVLALGVVWIRKHPLPAPAPVSTASGVDCLDAAAKQPLPGFTARRALAPNHWIGQDDLDWTSAKGSVQQAELLAKYSSCPIKPGDRVIPLETRLLPLIEVPTGRVRHILPLGADPRLPAAINAASTVDVWEGSTLVARGLPVLAVQCRTGMLPPSGDCWADIGATTDDIARLQRANPTVLRIVTAKP